MSITEHKCFELDFRHLALQETRGCTETRVHRDHARIRLLWKSFLYVFTVFTTWSLLLERDQPEAFHSPWPFENQVDEMAQQVGLSRFLAQRLTDFEPQARGLYRLSSYLRLAILQGISWAKQLNLLDILAAYSIRHGDGSKQKS
jgi:hypothetical protein